MDVIAMTSIRSYLLVSLDLGTSGLAAGIYPSHAAIPALRHNRSILPVGRLHHPWRRRSLG